MNKQKEAWKSERLFVDVMCHYLNVQTGQPTVLHELGHNEDGLLGHHGEQAHQPGVLQGLHHVGLGEELLHRHGADLQVLDGHLPFIVVDA